MVLRIWGADYAEVLEVESSQEIWTFWGALGGGDINLPIGESFVAAHHKFCGHEF